MTKSTKEHKQEHLPCHGQGHGQTWDGHGNGFGHVNRHDMDMNMDMDMESNNLKGHDTVHKKTESIESMKI